MKKKYTHFGFITQIKESVKRESATYKILHLSQWKKLMLFASILSLSILATASANHHFTDANTQHDICDANMSTLMTDWYFVDLSIKNIQPFIEAYGQASANTFQLFSHGKPGELFIEGEWKNAAQLAHWLSRTKPQDATHINIYGCEFAKGKKGKAAVSYLETALGVSIAASDDITGKDGDWELEVGEAKTALKFPDYQSNLQACNCNDYLYVNDPTEDLTHKFLIDPNDGSVSTATEVGNPWLSANVIRDAHGVVGDLNGNIYIAQRDVSFEAPNALYKLSCSGEVIESDAVPNWLPITNLTIIDNVIYSNQSNFQNPQVTSIIGHDLCDFSEVSSCPLDPNVFYWGLSSDYNGNLYYTGHWFDNSASPDYSHRIFRIDPTTCTSTEVVNLPNTDPDLKPLGVTFDEFGNIYFAVTNYGNNVETTIYKFDPSGNLINSINDNNSNQSGFGNTWGIAYNEATQTLYAGTLNEDCIAVFNSGGQNGNISYQPSLGIGYVPSTYSKAINIVRECCPSTTPIVVDTTFTCTDAANLDKVYLQDLIDCDGIVCEGLWVPEPGCGGGAIMYNDCDNSIELSPGGGCCTFTKSSNGGGNAVCGAFSIEVNICVTSAASPPAIDVVDNDCAAGTPGSFTVTTDCTVGSTLEWSLDGGATWSTTTPTYDDNNSITAIARCVGAGCPSDATPPVTSMPDGTGQACPITTTGINSTPIDTTSIVDEGATAIDGGAGDGTWTAPNDGLAADGTNASYSFTTSDGSPTASTSNTIQLIGFNFSSIPSNATILGVEAEITGGYVAETSSAIFCPNILSTAVINNAQLLIGGAASGNNNGGISWGSAILGDSTDLWGNTLTVSDVQNPNFGIELQGSMAGLQYCPGFFGVGQGDNTGILELDGVSLTIHYATPEERSFDCNAISSLTFSVTDVGGGATYEWTVPAGMNITGGQNTASITANGSGLATGATHDICVTTTDACGTYEPCCISVDNNCVSSCTNPAAPTIAVTDNDCDAGIPGTFTVTTACAAGSTIEWSSDNGTTWSSTAPTYSNANAQTVIARCVDDADNTCVSADSPAVTSSPTVCPGCPTPNCFGITIQQN